MGGTIFTFILLMARQYNCIHTTIQVYNFMHLLNNWDQITDLTIKWIT